MAALFLLIGLLAGAVVWAPARWLTSLVEDGSGQRVRFVDPAGTLWKGSAQVVLTGGAGSRERMALPGRLAWEWSWPAPSEPPVPGAQATLLTLTLMLQQETVLNTAMALNFAMGWNHWSLQGTRPSNAPAVQLRLPASWLGGLGAPWNTLQPGGELRLDIQRLQVWGGLRAAPEFDLDLQLHLLDLRSRVSTLPRLGSYGLHAAGRNELRLKLSTHGDSPLILNGQGRWSPAGRVEFQGVAQAAPDQEAALANLLNIIGRRDGSRSLIQL